jgi:hypothetical protein
MGVINIGYEQQAERDIMVHDIRDEHRGSYPDVHKADMIHSLGMISMHEDIEYIRSRIGDREVHGLDIPGVDVAVFHGI